jgi:hypothetical protein
MIKLSWDDVQDLVPATGTSKSDIFRAAFVHRHALELANSVMAGNHHDLRLGIFS